MKKQELDFVAARLLSTSDYIDNVLSKRLNSFILRHNRIILKRIKFLKKIKKNKDLNKTIKYTEKLSEIYKLEMNLNREILMIEREMILLNVFAYIVQNKIIGNILNLNQEKIKSYLEEQNLDYDKIISRLKEQYDINLVYIYKSIKLKKSNIITEEQIETFDDINDEIIKKAKTNSDEVISYSNEYYNEVVNKNDYASDKDVTEEMYISYIKQNVISADIKKKKYEIK